VPPRLLLRHESPGLFHDDDLFNFGTKATPATERKEIQERERLFHQGSPLNAQRSVFISISRSRWTEGMGDLPVP